MSLRTLRQEHRPAAITSPFGDRTFAQLNARINQLARLLLMGLPQVTPLRFAENRPAFIEAYRCAPDGSALYAGQLHLTADEAGCVIDDCEARAIYDGVGDEWRSERATAVTSTDVDGSARIRRLRCGHRAICAGHCRSVLGTQMLYTSGTTANKRASIGDATASQRTALQTAAAWNLQTDMCLCTGRRIMRRACVQHLHPQRGRWGLC
jgi:long-chain acyl-CoA synthetase